MTLQKYTSTSMSVGNNALNGGLNSTSGPLGLQDNESSDLQNIDFNKFGSVFKRNGYQQLNTVTNGAGTSFDGLHWYEYNSAGSEVRQAMAVGNSKILKMDTLDGTWDDITEDQSVTFTGAGLDDATSSGIYDGSGDIEYKVVIDGTGTPDTFEWFKDDVSQAAGVNISGAEQILDNDLGITFAATTGHTISDQWVFHPATIVTDGYPWTFTNFLNTVYATNGEDAPWQWDGSGNARLSQLPVDIVFPKFNELFNNFLFYAYVGQIEVPGEDPVTNNSRVYWSNLKDTSTWEAAHFIDVAKDDGQEITGIKVLADRLVIYKTRSIYNMFYTGDTDIPFIMPGGGKTASAVGCVASHTIQEVNNGHVFLSHDGFYFFDGNTSYKISEKISNTILGYNTLRLNQSVSLVQRDKNRYMCTMVSSGQASNDRILVWDYFNNAWSIYVGIDASAMATFYTNGDEEQIYFGDYDGYVYQMDVVANDNPAGVPTAIDAYYWTNWRHFGDLVNKKGIPEIALYYEYSNSILTLAYAYDFEGGEQFSQTFSLAGASDVYGVGIYGTAVYGSSGGAVRRRDLTGRGRVVRMKYANATLSETFQIDGMGTLAHLETNV